MLNTTDNKENGFNPYTNNGYANRRDYLECLAEDYGDKVYAVADMLGETEDFDGLVAALEDDEL